MLERFTTALDCVDIGFIPDGLLDRLPQPSQTGPRRTAGVDLNRPRTRNALAAVLALAPAPGGFTVADLTGKVNALQDHISYTAPQAAYDLCKLRGKNLVERQGKSHRYHSSTQSTRTISALLTLREHVIAPIIAGVRSPKLGRNPSLTGVPLVRLHGALRSS